MLLAGCLCSVWVTDEMNEKRMHRGASVECREDSNHKLKSWCDQNWGGPDTVRGVDRNAEALIWCRKCLGYARQKLGSKKMQDGENGHVLKRISTLEEERVPATIARWKIEGSKRRVTRVECKRLREEFEVRGVVVQKESWNIATKRMLELRTEKTETCSVNTKPCTKKTFSAGCGRMWKVKKKRGKRSTRKPRKRARKSGKRVVEGESERVETSSKRICMVRSG